MLTDEKRHLPGAALHPQALVTISWLAKCDRFVGRILKKSLKAAQKRGE